MGGPNAVTPGDTGTATQTFEPGNYVFVCWIPTADGTPHIMKGMMHAMVVKPNQGPAVAEPTAALSEGFAFDDGAPVREFQRELYFALAGPRSPWSHDPRGTLDAMRDAEPGILEDFRVRHYQMAQASAAVVGPVTEIEATGVLNPIGSGPLPVPPLDDRVAWEK